MGLKYEIQELTTVKKTIQIEIPQEVVQREFNLAYGNLRRKAKVSGFRPGKAPMEILEDRYAKAVEEEIIQKMVPDYYRQAIEESGLKPVELPTIEQVTVRRDAPLSFTATVEVRPGIKVKGHVGMRMDRERIAVTEEQIREALNRLQNENGQLEFCEPQQVIEQGHHAVIDIQGFFDGKPLKDSQAKGFLMEVGSRTLLPGIEDALIGKKKGETTEARVMFPKDHPEKHLAEKEVTYQIQIQEVKIKNLPEIDDQFAKDLGFSSLEEVRKKIGEDLQKHMETERAGKEKDRLVKELISQHSFEVPPSLAHRELQDILSRHPGVPRADSAPGGPDTEIELKALAEQYRPLAEERARGRLLLQALAEQEGLTVDDQEIEEKLAGLARGMKTTTPELKQWILSKDGSLDGIRSSLLESKALDFIHSRAKFKEG